MTSLRWMFIQLSQLTRWPLYVSPFFNSTSWGSRCKYQQETHKHSVATYSPKPLSPNCAKGKTTLPLATLSIRHFVHSTKRIWICGFSFIKKFNWCSKIGTKCMFKKKRFQSFFLFWKFEMSLHSNITYWELDHLFLNTKVFRTVHYNVHK